MYRHDKTKDRQLILQQAKLFVQDTVLAVSLLANITALLKQYYSDVNWLGFYLAEKDKLYLGPFQGESACLYIPFGQGVCGTAAETREIQLVSDVREIENHIVCDERSLSEIVVPIIIDNEVYGVLDIDAPKVNYFDEADKEFLQEVIDLIIPTLKSAK